MQITITLFHCKKYFCLVSNTNETANARKNTDRKHTDQLTYIHAYTHTHIHTNVKEDKCQHKTTELNKCTASRLIKLQKEN